MSEDADGQAASALNLLIRKLERWNKLGPDDHAAILALPYATSTLQRSDCVVRDGERTTTSCLMISGFSIRSKTVLSGKRQILSIHMRGELVDLQNSLLGVADHSVEMLTIGRIARIPRDRIVQLAFERPDVGKALWLDTLVDGSIFREWIANVGRRDAPTRIAHLLCEFALRMKVAGLGDRDRYDLPMTQEQLADATGMTSVHVNRTLRALEGEDLIDRPHPRMIHIRDWRKLAAAGDFRPDYLHLNERELSA